MKNDASHKEPHASDEHGDGEHIHLWGRDIDRDDFMEGHYADDRQQPTPEGGQAGIAQGNVQRKRTAKARRNTQMG